MIPKIFHLCYRNENNYVCQGRPGGFGDAEKIKIGWSIMIFENYYYLLIRNIGKCRQAYKYAGRQEKRKKIRKVHK